MDVKNRFLVTVVASILVTTIFYKNMENVNKLILSKSGVKQQIIVDIAIHEHDKSERLMINQTDGKNNDISWIKYGEENSDWALVMY